MVVCGQVGYSLRLLPEEANPESILNEKCLDTVKSLCSLPKNANFSLPEPYQRPDWVVPGKVCFYEIAFRTGLRLPLPLVVKEVLSFFGICPGQLMPNGWRLLLAFQVLCDRNKIGGSLLLTFLHSYYPKSHVKERGRIQFHKRSRNDPLVLEVAGSESVEWKSRYFFVDEALLFGSERPNIIPSCWNPLNPEDLGGHSSGRETENNVAILTHLNSAKRNCRHLLSPKEFIHSSVWIPALTASKVSADQFMEDIEKAEMALKAYKFPDVLDGKNNPRPNKKKRNEVSSSQGAPRTTWGIITTPRINSCTTQSDFGGGLSSHEDCLNLNQKAIFQTVKERLLPPEEEKILNGKGLVEVAIANTSNILMVAQSAIFLEKQVEGLVLEIEKLRASLDESKQLCSETKRKLMEAEAQVSKATSTALRMTEQVDRIAREGIDRGKAQGRLSAFRKFIKRTKPTDEDIKAEIEECKKILGISMEEESLSEDEGRDGGEDANSMTQ